MREKIFNTEAQKFIKANENLSIEEVLLKSKNKLELDIPLLAAQIEGKKKAKRKLPTWNKTEGILFPVKLSMEQCSSEHTASYKASLITGDTLVDLTGGFGVDAMAFSNVFKTVEYVERNPELVEIVTHNVETFGQKNIICHAALSEDFLKNYKEKSDWVFIDPARRKEGGKVFKFDDCEPNIIEMSSLLFQKTKNIMIKTSPLLDINAALLELKGVYEVHVLSIDNECKELLFLLSSEKVVKEPLIVAVNFVQNAVQKELRFTRKEEALSEVSYTLPKKYLYEPNASILKAGGFKSVANQWNLSKLHVNSHLYTSDNYYSEFPGRSFTIEKILKYDTRILSKELPEKKANIAVRNFPDTVAMIRKKTKIMDGGDVYIFATTDLQNNFILLKTFKTDINEQ